VQTHANLQWWKSPFNFGYRNISSIVLDGPSASRTGPFMINNTQYVYRQIINFELVETSFLDYYATDGKSANRQYTDGGCAECRRSDSKRQ
jgi:hypothetical protein